MSTSPISAPSAEATPPPDLELERVRRLAAQEGAHSLSDAELVAVILGKASRTTSPMSYAQALLSHFGGVASLSKAHIGGLRTFPGLGLAQAARLLASCELGRRGLQDSTRSLPRHPLSKEAVAQWAQPRLVGLDHEEVWVLCVDAQSMLRSTWQVGRGGIHGCGLLARDLLTPVIRDAASGFVLVHNHPSGDPTPSQEDIELTQGLAAAATAVCVPLLDHVVVARDGYRSFFDLGLL